MSSLSGRRLSAALALALCSLAPLARAHAPELRQIAVAPGGALALALPGFGLVVRTQPGQPFAYVCDALLFPRFAATAPAMAFQADGTLLLAGAAGVRIVASDGCPLPAETSELYEAEVVALAHHAGATEVSYAVATGSFAGLWRSVDGGRHWQLRSQLEAPELVTALFVSPTDPERVYLSKSGPQTGSVAMSSDGGASFVSHAQGVTRTLLNVQAGASDRLWAWSRDALSTGNRGYSIQRADTAEGPWQPLLRVAYLGGFASDAQGVITVGDELGGLFRSSDDGATFQQLVPELSVACLGLDGQSLWACTLGTPQQPALQRMLAGEPFSPVVGLAEVERLASCAPPLDVERVCAAAFHEWQRDVLMRPLPAQDAAVAMASEDAGASELAPDADLQTASQDAGRPVSQAARSAGGGCSVTRGAGTAPHGCALLLAVLLSLRLGLRTRLRALPAPVQSAGTTG